MFRSKPFFTALFTTLGAFTLVTVGCGPKTEDAPDTGNCTAQVLFAFNPDARKCVQYDCDRPDNLEGSYPSMSECESDNRIGGDAGMGTDGGADTGTTQPEDTGAQGGDTGSQGGDTGGQGGEDAGGQSGDTGDHTGGDAGGPSGDTGQTGDTGADTSAPKTCGDYNKTGCFSHSNCPSTQRCENVQSASNPLSCCSAGQRGDLKAGEECDGPNGQIDCASGVCVTGSSGPARCSKPCESKKDCPEGMKKCVSVIGGNNSWCFPSN